VFVGVGVADGGGSVNWGSWVGSGVGEAAGEGAVAVRGSVSGREVLSPTAAGVAVGSKDSTRPLVNEHDNVTRQANIRVVVSSFERNGPIIFKRSNHTTKHARHRALSGGV